MLVSGIWFCMFRRRLGKSARVDGLLDDLNIVGDEIRRGDHDVAIPEVVGVNRERSWSQKEQCGTEAGWGNLNQRIKKTFVGDDRSYMSEAIRRPSGLDRVNTRKDSRPFTATVNESTSYEGDEKSLNLMNDSVVTD